MVEEGSLGLTLVFALRTTEVKKIRDRPNSPWILIYIWLRVLLFQLVHLERTAKQ